MSFTEGNRDALRIFIENTIASAMLARSMGAEISAVEAAAPVIGQIIKIAEESIPLARIMDRSDLVLHAEGPGAEHNLPWLSALNWLTNTANKNLRGLIRSSLDLLGVDGKRLAREADLRLSGLAPGSLWIGLKLVIPESPLLPNDRQVGAQMCRLATRLPLLARFIDEETLSPGINEAEPDPALRDAAMMALLNFAPTGKRGIHTLGVSSADHGSAQLSLRERVVLTNALSHPGTGKTRNGSFEGMVRAADLDKTRFHLRLADGHTLRCIQPALHAEQARLMLGRPFRIFGQYESDKDNTPRLLYVEKIEALPETGLLI